MNGRRETEVHLVNEARKKTRSGIGAPGLPVNGTGDVPIAIFAADDGESVCVGGGRFNHGLA